jgi:pimeloyl-ACP methyl ester carboxylesterase
MRAVLRVLAVVPVLLVLAGSVTALHAQDISGIWQSTTDGRQRVLEISVLPGGKYHGQLYFLGEKGGALNGNVISSIAVKDGAVSFTEDRLPGTFEGMLSADGNSLTGTWQVFGPPQPMTFARATPQTAWVIDPSPHKVLFVPVDKGVTLEVLDWGGSGPPLVFLAGLGNTAHIFDSFAPKFTGKHHVYAITRRGYGVSSAPPPTEENYNADRLGDDVVAVLDVLKIDRPVLVGHSIAGGELSSVGTRHPDKVSGLVYLEAGYDMAFYEPDGNTFRPDINTVAHDLVQLYAPGANSEKLIREIQATLPRLQKNLRWYEQLVKGQSQDTPPVRLTPQQLVDNAILRGIRGYTEIKPPFLAIYAVPPACKPHCDTPAAKASRAMAEAQVKAVQVDYPKAHIVRLPYASHYVYRSNEADVEREMKAWLDRLPEHGG